MASSSCASSSMSLSAASAATLVSGERFAQSCAFSFSVRARMSPFISMNGRMLSATYNTSATLLSYSIPECPPQTAMHSFHKAALTINCAGA